MNNKLFWPLASLFVVAALGITLLGVRIHVGNQLIAKQAELQAKYDTNRTLLGAYARDIETETGLANQGLTKLDQVLKDAVSGRYDHANGSTAVPGGQPALFSAIKEAYPNIDTSLYNEIAGRVHEYEIKFQNEQTTLASMAANFDVYRKQFPTSMFAGGYPSGDLHAYAMVNGVLVQVTGQQALDQMKNLVSSGEANDAFGNGEFNGPQIPKN